MDIEGIEPSPAKKGTLVLGFGKIVWQADKDLIAALQKEGIVAPFEYSPRALNTKVLAMPWLVPTSKDVAAAQQKALISLSGAEGRAHAELNEARGFPIDLADHFIDDDDKKAGYLDGGELTVAFARGAPDRLADAMPFLRAPQRPDWFMDALAAVAARTKDAHKRAFVYDAIASMAVPSASNKHHKTYVRCVSEAAAAFREAGDAGNADRLEKKAAMFVKKKR
jgi:hypothetical protein